MNSALERSLMDYLLAMADDELILGHRDSEWCGHAPLLEEDIAFANLALDEIGHALAWYGLLADLAGEDAETFPDRLVYFREAEGFRNIRLAELPNGDWAFSMLRQYLFDAFEILRLEALATSRHQPLAEVAAKIRKEEVYHLRHTRAWIRRLGLGTPESRARLQEAFDRQWPYAGQLFEPLPGEGRLVSAGFLPASASLEEGWAQEVLPLLAESGLSLRGSLRNAQREGREDGKAAAAKIPGASPDQGRRRHTPHLAVLVGEMQSVARLEPEATW